MHRTTHQITVVLLTLLTLSSFFNTLFNASPNAEYSNLNFPSTSGLNPKSLLAKYSYLSNSLDDNAEIVAACLSKLQLG